MGAKSAEEGLGSGVGGESSSLLENGGAERSGSHSEGSTAPRAGSAEATGEGSGGSGPPPSSEALVTPFASPFMGPVVPSEEQLLADVRSRTAFGELGREAATSLGEKIFHIDVPTWSAPGSEAGARVTRYLSAYTASEERPGGKHVLVQSTVPLQVENGSGQTPVSLALREQGGAYVPANALVPISISQNVASGVSFPPAISVAPAAAAAPEPSVLVGNRVFFPNTATDTDFMVEPIPDGAELSWLLRSERSPEENALVFSLPSGSTLKMSTSLPGGAEVVAEGQTVLAIPPALAQQADGESLPVTYSVSGDTLTTHVNLSGNVDFPLLVDPEVIGYYDSNGYGWPYWNTYESGCSCFRLENRSSQLAIETTEPLQGPQGQFGEWYINPGDNNWAKITRVDVTGANHVSDYYNDQTDFEAGIYLNGNYMEEPAVHTYNGTNASESRPGPLVEGEGLSERAIAFCAHGAGGADGSSQPLCNENYGGEGFSFLLYLNSPNQELWTAYAALGTATVHYVQTTPPNISTEGSAVASGWTSASNPPFIKVEGKDGGTGVESVGVDAVSGIVPVQSMPTPGSSPAPGFANYDPTCNDPFCPEWAWKSQYITQLPTGVWTLGAWTRDPVDLSTEQDYTAAIDKSPPVIETPAWAGATLGDGPHTLNFSAQDGSSSAPQSGTESIDVYVDGRDVYEDVTMCPKPEGANLIPSASCLGLNGSWTLEGEDYGAGPHTITLRAEDWVGNVSERTFDITINHPVAATQQVGPGTLNLRSGEYTLGATDVSVPAGAADLTVSRSYNSMSQEAPGEAPGPLGPGWTLATPDTSAAGQWQSLQPLSNGNVEATTTGGRKVVFAAEPGGGYTSPTGFETYTLTALPGSPVVYRITDSGGDYTQFAEPSGATAFMPTAVAQTTGERNKVTYVLSEGRTSEIQGPPASAGESCTGTLGKGCRVLTLHYATSTSASGEAPSEWGEYAGRLASVSFAAWSTTQGKIVTTPVAQYAYDKQGRLRAEWDPRISPALKTTYGYDGEAHLTALTPPGQETWAFTYGTIAGDANAGRLLKVTRAPASAKLWTGEAAKNSEAPRLLGSPVVGYTIGATTGAWSAEPVVYAYRWEDCNGSGTECTPILGADNATYTAASSDLGHALVVQVTATNGGGSVTTSSSPSAPVGSGLAYNSQFGAAGTGNGQFNHPADVVVDSKGNLWVLDRENSRVEEFNAKGEYTKAFGSKGSGNGQIDEPDGLALDAKGNVWVIDTGNARVEEFNEKGEFTKAFGSSGSGNGQFNTPEGIAIDSHGNVWVSDTGNGRIEEFSEKGEFLKTAGSPGSGSGQLGEPEGLAVGPGGNVWVADWSNDRVEEFNEKAEFVREFGSDGTGNGQFKNPYGITVEADGDVWVADTSNDRVEEFTQAGEYLAQFGSAGSGAGQFSFKWPIGLAADSKGDMWVTDSKDDRIEKWTIPVSSGPISPQAGTTIEYNVPVAGAGAPYQLSATEVAKWAQTDPPSEAAAVFPPDEPEGWPAEDYKRAIVVYFDASGRRVNVATPGGAISTTQYDAYDNAERQLTPGNRARALEAGSESSAKAELVETQSTYRNEGSELESSVGPRHEVKLANGTVTQARARTRYYYDEGAPASEIPHRLVTKTTEGALLPNGEEKEVRTVKTSYSGQGNLGWELHKPTTVTTEPESGQTLTRTNVYSPETGDLVETVTPGAAHLGSVPSYALQVGKSGSGDGELSDPRAVTLDAEGKVWVADTANNRIEEFSASGSFIEMFGFGVKNGKLRLEVCTAACKTGIASAAKGALAKPEGIAYDPRAQEGRGALYVSDTGNDRVEEFSTAGKFIRHFGLAGTGIGDLNSPLGLTVDSSGNVWVADSGNDRLEKFTERGTKPAVYGKAGKGEGEFSGVTDVTYCAGKLYAADSGGERVEEFLTSGAPAGQLGAESGRFTQVSRSACDPVNNDLYVTDSGAGRVDMFTSAGGFVEAFGSAGSGGGQLDAPAGVAVGDSGAAYVADSANDRVSEWLPPSAGHNAHDTQTIYYGAAANASYPECGEHAEWANLPCRNQPAAQPGTSGLPNLPITTYTYNIWDEPLTATETAGSAVRTSTQTYDAAGRTKESSISSSSGEAVPTVADSYSEATGALVGQSTTNGGHTASIKSAFNTLGQLTSYTDAAGNTATYEYELAGDARLTKVNDGKGTQTFVYTETGALGELTDSGAGKLSAQYNAEGKVSSETYPNGMKVAYTYNTINETTALAYTKGAATWYKDEVLPSIHGEWLSQTSTLGSESYVYDELGRLTAVQETPAGKGCTTELYSYDADSNRIGETRREPTSGGACAAEGGTIAAHNYDEADRLIDPGVAYEPLGEDKALPAADAGEAPLESAYYADGALYSQTQGEKKNTYTLDPAGRVLETTTVTGTKSAKSTISHYTGPSSTPSWTEAEGGAWARNIGNIQGGLAATQTSGAETVIVLANLHGDVIGTVPDSASAEKAKLTSEPTAFGVPTTAPESKYSWLGSDGLQTEFSSGVAASSSGSYVPQLGLYLEPAGLTGAASQDPVNAYLAGETLAQPTGGRTVTLPGAIEPLPVNSQVEKEFWESPPWDKPPVNAPGEEEPDPAIFLGYHTSQYVALVLRNAGSIAEVVSKLGKYLGPVAKVLAYALELFGEELANEIATGLENCTSRIYYATSLQKYDRCKLFIYFEWGWPPIDWGVETCFGDEKHPYHYCWRDSLTESEF